MSISSSFRVDDSTALAKQFASMAAGYFDNPPNTKANPAALVPLENVFRLLEMFRYDAFADESREGVLAMDAPDQIYRLRAETKPWHEQIAQALQIALQQAYDANQQKEAAIDELQNGIRELVRSHHPDDDVANRAKTFFTVLHAQLG
ncbi:MAG: hypothetical protein KZQ92_01855 [Candidatus Thiodiazotropha sp. (ex Lucinoma borealis)]|nr:hypothetical protein [Candidatus Thiodiazotropha sp. (ex Lucinoma borealis)]MCU7862702.1 hypothetical protein [Candidatus Thiodiazotropha sp. (ex Lucinoma borealis)]